MGRSRTTIYDVARACEVSPATVSRVLQRAGLSRIDVLGAATWRAREWLGHAGLDEGDPADLVILKEDPREDLRTLSDPVAIVLRGVRVV